MNHELNSAFFPGNQSHDWLESEHQYDEWLGKKLEAASKRLTTGVGRTAGKVAVHPLNQIKNLSTGVLEGTGVKKSLDDLKKNKTIEKTLKSLDPRKLGRSSSTDAASSSETSLGTQVPQASQATQVPSASAPPSEVPPNAEGGGSPDPPATPGKYQRYYIGGGILLFLITAYALYKRQQVRPPTPVAPA